jgi:photosystem II stability/assembly factor-like uncharacterized protein
MKMNVRKRKSISIALLPLFLSVVLTTLLTACGSPGSAAMTQGASTSTSVSPSSNAASAPAAANTITSTTIDPLRAIRMLDANNGWAITTKNAILKTSDGGHHWQDVTSKTVVPGKNAVGEFLTAQAAWIAWQAGPNQPIKIQHTSDGGVSWQTATINNITGGLAEDTLRFINPQQGWLLTSEAEGMLHYTVNIYRTTDGGQSWTNVSNPLRWTAPSGLSFSGTQIGWSGLYWPGPTLQVQKTANGGKSWQQLQLPTPAGITNEQIGDTTTTAPVLIGANGLLPAHINMNTNVRQVRLVLYTTHNSGTTWTAGTLANFDSNDVYALDTQHVWAEETNSNTLHISSDGGKTWAQRVQTPQHFGELSFVDTHNGWAIDDTGHLYQTTDGGTNWQKIA